MQNTSESRQTTDSVISIGIEFTAKKSITSMITRIIDVVAGRGKVEIVWRMAYFPGCKWLFIERKFI